MSLLRIRHRDRVGRRVLREVGVGSRFNNIPGQGEAQLRMTSRLHRIWAALHTTHKEGICNISIWKLPIIALTKTSKRDSITVAEAPSTCVSLGVLAIQETGAATRNSNARLPLRC